VAKVSRPICTGTGPAPLPHLHRDLSGALAGLWLEWPEPTACGRVLAVSSKAVAVPALLNHCFAFPGLGCCFRQRQADYARNPARRLILANATHDHTPTNKTPARALALVARHGGSPTDTVRARACAGSMWQGRAQSRCRCGGALICAKGLRATRKRRRKEKSECGTQWRAT
jgi:hypothetical protein